METPPRKTINLTQNDAPISQRKYTEEEKKQLLTNLELEGTRGSAAVEMTISRYLSSGSYSAVRSVSNTFIRSFQATA